MKKLFLIAIASILFFTSCNSKKKDSDDKMGDKKDSPMDDKESKEEKNREVIIASFDAFGKADLDKAFVDCDPTYMDSFDGTVAPMPADSVKVLFKSLMAAVPDYKGTNYHYVADGNTVIVLGDWSGTFKNDMMGMKATGKPFHFKDADIFTFNDNNKIIAHHSIANLGAVMMGTK